MTSDDKSPLRGLRVVSFESRRGQKMAELITQQGGEAIVAPAMREIPLEQNTEAFAFAEKLLAGEIDVMICLTGIGVDTLMNVLQMRYSAHQLTRALSSCFLVARGPKPAEALARYRLSVRLTVQDPSTSEEVLTELQRALPLQGKTVAVQEYGARKEDLIQGLAHAGARVIRVPVYRWGLPEDREPMRRALQRVLDGDVDIVLFTNSVQINHVLQLAQEEGVEQAFRDALGRLVVASVGPVTTQFLDEYGLPVDLEPERPKMEALVAEAGRRSFQLLEEKRGSGSTKDSLIIDPLPVAAGDDEKRNALHRSLFMRACRREPTERTPIWLMRQAGRYMKEYRDVRERHGFLELCKDSDLATEVTVYAVERLGVDAAIVFSDILLILEPMGLHLEYAKGDGPVIHNPLRAPSDLERLGVADPSALEFVYDAIRKTRRALPSNIPLIGFCGAPFTLASYLIEGQGSRNYIHTKSLMHGFPDIWDQLMAIIDESLIGYINAQIDAGAQAIQLFDSWVGCLSPDDYRRFVLPHSQRVIHGIRGEQIPLVSPFPKGEAHQTPPFDKGRPGGISHHPIIHFGTNTGSLLELMKEAGGDVIGLDWRVELDEAWRRLGAVAVQGNLDPTVLFSDPSEIRRQAKRILNQAAGRPGHIFNLGHGVLPNTPVGHVKALVDAVKELSFVRRGA